jgi:hypothetical protein
MIYFIFGRYITGNIPRSQDKDKNNNGSLLIGNAFSVERSA